MTETFGWGSEEIRTPQENLLQVPTSVVLKGIIVKITDSKTCGNSLGRELQPNEMCGIGYHEGETAVQVTHSN